MTIKLNRLSAAKCKGVVLCMLLCGLVLLASSGGCSAQVNLKGNLSEAGSTTVLPMAQKLSRSFMQRYSNAVINTGGGGSDFGIGEVNAGRVDIGAISRALTASDPALHSYLIGHDGIAIVTHPTNPLQGLLKQYIARIFSGEVTNWSQVGGRNARINIITREPGSGTLFSFQTLVMGGSKITDSAVVESSEGDVLTYVSTNPDAIGFLSLAYVDSTVRALDVDGVPATLENSRSGKYPLVRPLYFLTKDQAQGLAANFIQFAMSQEGQNIILNEGYLSSTQ